MYDAFHMDALKKDLALTCWLILGTSFYLKIQVFVLLLSLTKISSNIDNYLFCFVS